MQRPGKKSGVAAKASARSRPFSPRPPSSIIWRMNTPPPGRGSATDPASDGEAFAAAAHVLGCGIVEHESGGEIVLTPVHRRSDQIEQRTGIDEQYAARGFDPLVHRAGVRHIIHRIGKAGTAALGRRKAYAHRAFGRFGHQLADRKSTRLNSSH